MHKQFKFKQYIDIKLHARTYIINSKFFQSGHMYPYTIDAFFHWKSKPTHNNIDVMLLFLFKNLISRVPIKRPLDSISSVSRRMLLRNMQ